MLKNYLKISLRNLQRHKGYSLINIAGLAVGLACCVLMLLYIRHELSYDRHYEKAERIYRIDLSWPIFLLAGTLALAIAFFTVSYQAIRAALADPVKALRYE